MDRYAAPVCSGLYNALGSHENSQSSQNEIRRLKEKLTLENDNRKNHSSLGKSF